MNRYIEFIKKCIEEIKLNKEPLEEGVSEVTYKKYKFSWKTRNVCFPFTVPFYVLDRVDCLYDPLPALPYQIPILDIRIAENCYKTPPKLILNSDNSIYISHENKYINLIKSKYEKSLASAMLSVLKYYFKKDNSYFERSSEVNYNVSKIKFNSEKELNECPWYLVYIPTKEIGLMYNDEETLYPAVPGYHIAFIEGKLDYRKLKIISNPLFPRFLLKKDKLFRDKIFRP